MTQHEKAQVAELLQALHMLDVVKSEALKADALNRVRAAIKTCQTAVAGHDTCYRGPEE